MSRKRISTRGRRGKKFGAKWSIGGSWSHPVFGKIGGGFNSKSLSAKVKSIVRKDIETPQHAVLADSNTTFVPLKNIVYATTFLDSIPQGTNGNDRVGDVIHLDALKYNFTFTGVSGSSVYDKTFRILLIKKDITTNTAGVFSSGVFGLNTMAMQDTTTSSYTGTTYVNNMITDPKKITVLFDQEYVLKAPYDAGSNQIDSKTVAGTIRLDQKYVYQSNQSYGKDYNLYWVVMASIPVGATGSVNVGTVLLNQDLIFKNCV